MKRSVVLLCIVMVMVMAAGCGMTEKQADTSTSSETAGESSTTEGSSSGTDGSGAGAGEENTGEWDPDYVPTMMRPEAYAVGVDTDEYVTLGEYKGIEVKLEDWEITDKEVTDRVLVRYEEYTDGDGHIKDEDVKELGIEGVETEAELREYIRESLISDFEADDERIIQDTVLAELTKRCGVKELPQEMLERHGELMLRALYMQVYYRQQYGQETTAEELLAQTMEMDGYEGTEEEYMAMLSKRQAEQTMILCAIAKAEGIEVTEEEYEAALKEVLEANGYEDAEGYSNYTGMDTEMMIREELTADKALEMVVEEAVVE